jgi:NAD(P)-dependent dehydrogenase (short-subunit alcohol dehydrogenase family)
VTNAMMTKGPTDQKRDVFLQNLCDKVAVVTRASSGIGKAIALANRAAFPGRAQSVPARIADATRKCGGHGRLLSKDAANCEVTEISIRPLFKSY